MANRLGQTSFRLRLFRRPRGMQIQTTYGGLSSPVKRGLSTVLSTRRVFRIRPARVDLLEHLRALRKSDLKGGHCQQIRRGMAKPDHQGQTSWQAAHKITGRAQRKGREADAFSLMTDDGLRIENFANISS